MSPFEFLVAAYLSRIVTLFPLACIDSANMYEERVEKGGYVSDLEKHGDIFQIIVFCLVWPVALGPSLLFYRRDKRLRDELIARLEAQMKISQKTA